MVAGHYDLPNFTPLRMLSVWFQPTEVAKVITWERVFMLHELHAQGVSISAIARQTGLDRKTVRRHLAEGIQAPVYGPRAPQGSLLGRFTAYLQARLDQYPGLSGARLLREIQAQGYTGGYTILTDYLRTIRPPQEAGYEVRFETPAGHQGQVDFAHFKVRFRYDPQVVRVVWLFSLVLGHSRYLFGRFVWRQTLDVVVAAHEAAFAELGGVPVRGFTRRYTKVDIRLLAAMDERHNTPNGLTLKKLCERAYAVFGQAEYERLAGISVSHLYNLRQSQTYRRQRHTIEKTRPVTRDIGARRKPQSDGQPCQQVC